MAKGTPAGRIVRSGEKARTQAVRVFTRDDGRPTRWCEAVEEEFLAELAATCNVRAAADAVGFSCSGIYQRRAKYPAFAAEWDAAVATGYARLEARLVELATDSLRAPEDRDGRFPPPRRDAGLGRRPQSGAPGLPPVAGEQGRADARKDEREDEREEPSPIGVRMTVAEAINVLRLHRRAVKGEGPQRWCRPAPDADAMRESIRRKIEAIRRARALPEAADGEGDPA